MKLWQVVRLVRRGNDKLDIGDDLSITRNWAIADKQHDVCAASVCYQRLSL